MYEDIKKILVASFKVAPEDFHDDMTIEELDLDSLDMVELSLQLEQFGAQVSDDEIADAKTLGNLIELLESRRIAAAN